MPRHQGLYNGDGKQQPSDTTTNAQEIYCHRIVLYPKDFLRSLTADKLSKGMVSLSK